jgi:hypothetical protein
MTVDLSEESMELARLRAAVFGRRTGFVLRGECGTIERLRAAGALRFDLVVWSDSPHAESGCGAEAASAVHAAGHNLKIMVYRPAVVESA